MLQPNSAPPMMPPPGGAPPPMAGGPGADMAPPPPSGPLGPSAQPPATPLQAQQGKQGIGAQELLAKAKQALAAGQISEAQYKIILQKLEALLAGQGPGAPGTQPGVPGGPRQPAPPPMAAPGAGPPPSQAWRG